MDLPGSHLIKEQPSEQESKDVVLFSEATELYLRLKGTDKAKTFHGAARRACRYLAQCCGDKDLGDIKRGDATKLRDFLAEKGLSGSSIVREEDGGLKKKEDSVGTDSHDCCWCCVRWIGS